MSFARSIAAAALLASLTVVPSIAHAAPVVLDFVVVKSVTNKISSGSSTRHLVISGILAGTDAVIDKDLPLGSSADAALVDTIHSCERYATLAMSKPGKYELVITTDGSGVDCRLVRSDD